MNHMMNSNTTLVKVNLPVVSVKPISIFNSNTTLVKVNRVLPFIGL